MEPDFVANNCGGARWRTDSSGLIEVEGIGIPIANPGTSRFQNLEQTWANFGSILGGAADHYQIPRAWALAFATVETGFLSANASAQATAVSPVGALGVMQLMPQFFREYSREDLLNPAVNIPAGVKFIGELCASSGCPWRCELPYLGSVYNAGSGSSCIQCSPGRNAFNFLEDSDYSMQLVIYNNTAITSLQLKSSTLAWTVGGAAIAAGAAWLFL